MQLFRRSSSDLSQAHTRSASIGDLTDIGRLLREAGKRYYGLSGDDLPQLLTTMPGRILIAPSGLLGVALPGWRAGHSTWLRCVAFSRGVDIHQGINTLLPALHHDLQQRNMQHIFYAGDETSDSWLLPALQQYGYQQDTTVVVYEKHAMHTPTQGNQHVVVRAVQSSDLPALSHLDALCFEPHWTKHETALSSAVLDHSFFVVAEDQQHLAGYAYATIHFGGRLVHLVRIAVHPRWRGKAIGARLLAELVSFARVHASDLITLNTQSYNEPAQQLYRWFGFAPNGEYQVVLRYTF